MTNEYEELQNKFKKREEDFEVYFETHGLSEFESLMGCSVEWFKDMYRQFKAEVSDYFDAYVSQGSTLHPLIADVCGVCSVDFFATLDSTDSMIPYPTVSVLKGEYYPTNPRVSIEFKDDEVVMKELLKSYFVNVEFYEEMKKCAETYAADCPLDEVDEVDGLEECKRADFEDSSDEEFPF